MSELTISLFYSILYKPRVFHARPGNNRHLFPAFSFLPPPPATSTGKRGIFSAPSLYIDHFYSHVFPRLRSRSIHIALDRLPFRPSLPHSRCPPHLPQIFAQFTRIRRPTCLYTPLDCVFISCSRLPGPLKPAASSSSSSPSPSSSSCLVWRDRPDDWLQRQRQRQLGRLDHGTAGTLIDAISLNSESLPCF